MKVSLASEGFLDVSVRVEDESGFHSGSESSSTFSSVSSLRKFAGTTVPKSAQKLF